MRKVELGMKEQNVYELIKNISTIDAIMILLDIK